MVGVVVLCPPVGLGVLRPPIGPGLLRPPNGPGLLCFVCFGLFDPAEPIRPAYAMSMKLRNKEAS
jgi:hypothetical protein